MVWWYSVFQAGDSSMLKFHWKTLAINICCVLEQSMLLQGDVHHVKVMGINSTSPNVAINYDTDGRHFTFSLLPGFTSSTPVSHRSVRHWLEEVSTKIHPRDWPPCKSITLFRPRSSPFVWSWAAPRNESNSKPFLHSYLNETHTQTYC